MSRGRVAPVGPPTGPPGDDRGCTVLHVDMDAFYASVELRSRPELRGLPVIVGGGGSRGVVLSATYEARVFGVASAMPMMRARRLCPDGGRHRAGPLARTPRCPPASWRSSGRSPRWSSRCRSTRRSSRCPGAARRLGGARAVGEWVRATVQDEQGITCSVGVATTKFVAKLASARCKPDGLLVVPADDVVVLPAPAAGRGAVGGGGEDRGGAGPARAAHGRRHRAHAAGDAAARPRPGDGGAPVGAVLGPRRAAGSSRSSPTRASARRRRSPSTSTTRR